MKKMSIIITAVVILVILIIGAVVLIKFNNKEEAPVHDLTTIEAQFDSDNKFLFVMGSSTCPACIRYREDTLASYSSSEYPIYFIYSDLGFENREQLNDFIDQYNLDYKSSPTSYIIDNGVIIAKHVGYMTKTELNNFIKDNR